MKNSFDTALLLFLARERCYCVTAYGKFFLYNVASAERGLRETIVTLLMENSVNTAT